MYLDLVSPELDEPRGILDILNLTRGILDILTFYRGILDIFPIVKLTINYLFNLSLP